MQFLRLNRNCWITFIILLIHFTGSSQCLNVHIGIIIDTIADPCDGPVTLDAKIPGAVYLWNTGDTTQKIKVTLSGQYFVKVDKKGCIGTDTTSVTFTDPPLFDLGSDPAPHCGGCVKLDAGNSGKTYLWSTGEITNSIDFCREGSHKVWVDVFSESGCKTSDTVNVTINPGLDPGLGNDTILCADSLVISAKAGKTFRWNTGADTETISVYSSATYIVEVMDENGCSGIDSIKVDLRKPPVLELGPDPAAICGGCVSLDAGEYPVTKWSTGETSGKIFFCKTGISKVKVFVSTGAGCSDEDSVTVNIIPGPDLYIGPDIIQCGGKVELISNIPAVTYKWSTGDTTRSVIISEDGLYTLEITDDKGCRAIDKADVKIQKQPVFDLGTFPERCGGCIQLNAFTQNAVSYYWSSGEDKPQIEYCKAGISRIWARATTSEGCSFTDTAEVSIKPGYMVDLGKDTAKCGGDITLDAGFSGSTYLWSTGETTRQITVNKSGIYQVWISDLDGCSNKDTITGGILVTFAPELLKPAGFTDLSGNCLNRKIAVDNVAGADSYTWLVPDGWQILSGQNTAVIDLLPPAFDTDGTVSVFATNHAGCISASRDTVVRTPDMKIFIPNAFTPNNDGINDAWVIRNINYHPENELVVLNRWGNEVFRQTSYQNNWNGSDLNEGTYFYQLKVKECEGEKEYKGSITILR
jgi:gliding motility-associated-like protein